jgi:hypothetical protein
MVGFACFVEQAADLIHDIWPHRCRCSTTTPGRSLDFAGYRPTRPEPAASLRWILGHLLLTAAIAAAMVTRRRVLPRQRLTPSFGTAG